jgi:hypothetical protein
MRKKRLQEIKAVLEYRRGDHYVGSIARSMVCAILGIRHGEGSISKALDNASDDKVSEVYFYLEDYIKYMNKNPVRKCLHCGSVVDVNTGKAI